MDGLLSGLFSTGDTLKRQLRGLLANPVGEAQQNLLTLGDASRQHLQDLGATTGRGVLGSDPAYRQAAQNRVQAATVDAAMNAVTPLTFAGVGAKTANKAALAQAEKMEAAGVDPRKIWSDTGWFRAPWDKKWRWEISDDAAKLDHPMPNIVDLRQRATSAKTLDEAKRIGDEYNYQMDIVRNSPIARNVSVTYKDSPSFQHGALLDAYPEKQPRIWWENIGAPKGGAFDEGTNRISVGLGSYADPLESKSVVLHELQHAIQQREGWARGGSPEAFKSPDAGALKVRQQMDELAKVLEDADKYGVPYMSYAENPPRWLSPEAVGHLKRWGYDRKILEGNIKEFSALGLPPDEAYRRLAGEAEARATQSRMNLNADQRRGLFPLDSFDVPVDQLIVRGLLGE